MMKESHLKSNKSLQVWDYKACDGLKDAVMEVKKRSGS